MIEFSNDLQIICHNSGISLGHEHFKGKQGRVRVCVPDRLGLAVPPTKKVFKPRHFSSYLIFLRKRVAQWHSGISTALSTGRLFGLELGWHSPIAQGIWAELAGQMAPVL